MAEPNDSLNKAWKDTCKILFGQDIGDYETYTDWLSELVDEPAVRKSTKSGKEVVFSKASYAKTAKVLSFDEIEINKQFEPLSINEIKDIDSILQAVNERMYYTGNMILGNSKAVEKSSNVNDSFCVSNSTLCGNSKYMAYCTLTRMDTHGFGGNAFSQCEFCLKCHELTRVKRSFELWMSQDTSDSYYSFGLKNCTNCMFSFNLENKKNMIGNLELPLEKYQEIRAKLISEMIIELKKEKRLPSLAELADGCGAVKELPKLPSIPSTKTIPDRKKTEDEFSKTMEILFRKKPSKTIDAYALWLARHVRGFQRCKSAVSGKDVFLAKYANYCDLPLNRLLTLEEAKVIGTHVALTKEEVEKLSIKNASELMSKIAFFNSDIQDGQNVNNLECPITIDAVNCYRSVCAVYSKNCAYSFWPRSSQNAFGCDSLFDSGFCINCYNSVNLQRCIEMDSCNSCSDSLFCHNSENLQDAMFCFNTKNKKYAIGNAEIAKDKYLGIKQQVLSQMLDEIERTGKYTYDIFALGS